MVQKQKRPLYKVSNIPLIVCSQLFPPDAGEGGFNFLLEAGDKFAVGRHQRLLGFDLRHNRLLRGERWEGDWIGGEVFCVDVRLADCATCELLDALLEALRVHEGVHEEWIGFALGDVSRIR